jgi:hypothetical protein
VPLARQPFKGVGGTDAVFAPLLLLQDTRIGSGTNQFACVVGRVTDLQQGTLGVRAQCERLLLARDAVLEAPQLGAGG